MNKFTLIHSLAQSAKIFSIIIALFYPTLTVYGYDSDFLDFLREEDDLIFEKSFDPETLPVGTNPTARLTIISDPQIRNQNFGTTATEFRFNASGSSDRETSSEDLQVRFDFENDGIFDTYFSKNKLVRHKYSSPGLKEVNLQVLDSSGRVTELISEVVVAKNTEPEAHFTVSPQIGLTSDIFEFKSNGSSDSIYENDSLMYRYDFDSDGIYDTNYSTSSIERERFQTTGKKTVTLQVIDKEGLTDTYSKQIVIRESTSPLAFFEVEPEFGYFSTSFKLDASESYDQETKLSDLFFNWDFDYKGDEDLTFDRFNSHTYRTRVRYNKPGTYDILLEVRDHEGNSQRFINTIKVSEFSEYFEDLRDFQILSTKELPENSEMYISRGRISRYLIKAMDEAEIIDFNINRSDYYDRFSDVTAENDNWPYIYEMVDSGLISEPNDDLFRPDQNMTRAETMVLVLNAFNRDYSFEETTLPYNDVKPEFWFYDAVKTAYLDGLIAENGLFRPNDLITEGEFAKVLDLAIQSYGRK